ncbi:serine O-acetyltransferase [Paenibacillus nanensis]|uniref:serine O-acetyltransferase n=1 Tax=Paenibacillus nanensis TaxID=393251 RepID=UPI0023E88309|nr:serine O-acetyltransferase [Paenibacillus nanensis]
MTFKELKYHWFSDLYRYEESMKVSMAKVFYRQFFFAGYHFMFWLRLCSYLKQKGKLCRPLYFLALVILQRYKYKYGIGISPSTKIGKGFYIGHFGGIVVNSNATIGENCVIMQGVTIGASNRGATKGVPTIGNNVYIGAGAKIIGNVRVGNYAAIGANAVVTKDVPDHAVVGGIPAKIISLEGSEGYISFPYPSEVLMKQAGLLPKTKEQ